MGETSSLRLALKVRFFPFAQERGFAIDLRRQPQLTTFRRRVDDDVHAFDIQWEKYGAACFVVNYGKSSLKQIPDDRRSEKFGEIAGFAADEIGRLYPGVTPSKESWFRLDVPLFKRLLLLRTSYRPEAVVDDLERLFPELEAWWETGTLGPHMHHFGRFRRADPTQPSASGDVAR